ncbi:unnamed protein product [Prorocentrum cordatum]|uniref:Uncharacterized protein n=1 Tax=Prorocentrum cordatum TaxID=2364126 RepID=A0ABN9T8C7_9DINO|nr:unnamed protein product [Polarella glacialis]
MFSAMGSEELNQAIQSGIAAAMASATETIVQQVTAHVSGELNKKFETVNNSLLLHHNSIQAQQTAMTQLVDRVNLLTKQCADNDTNLKRIASATSSTASSSGGSISGTAGFARQIPSGAKKQRGFDAVPGGDSLLKFVGTFPRPVLDSVRRKHWDQLVQHFPHLLSVGATPVFHSIAQTYAVKFEREDAAREFQRMANLQGMTWTDPRDGNIHPLRVKSDLPLDVRIRKRAFHHLWNPVRSLLMLSPHWQEGKCQLGVDGFKGVLRLRTESDVWELVSSKPMTQRNGEDCYQFEPHLSELEAWGISAEQINTIISKAHASAQEAGGDTAMD